MALGPEALNSVRRQLVVEVGEEKATIVGQMLVGFSSIDAVSPPIRKRIVALLSSDEKSVGIRELAIDTLTQLTGRDNLEYDPDHPEEKGLSAWRRKLGIGTVTNPRETTSQSTGMVLIRIEAAEFQMGSARGDDDAQAIEMPQHSVWLTRAYYLGKFEVTQEEYKKVVGMNPSRSSGNSKCPVEYVSWLDAIRYCNQMSERDGVERFYEISEDKVRVVSWEAPGYRLPTEAEWEYACRPTGGMLLHDDQANMDEIGWFNGNSGRTTHEVGQKRANSLGFFDMRGNVSEWCWDDFTYYPKADDLQKDPHETTGSPFRVVRGGDCESAAVSCRPESRLGIAPRAQSASLGFRVARYAAMTPPKARKAVPK
jgi:formylglycine-generating enzyme required for sulfatase activity